MNCSFPPYVAYRTNSKQISEFVELTGLSYGVAQQLLFHRPKEEVKKLLKPRQFKLEELSFSMADQAVERVELSQGWIPLSEYAEKTGLNIEDVQQSAARGSLGPVTKHPATDVDLVIWPPERQSEDTSTLPEPGKRRYTVTLRTDASVPHELDPENLDAFEATQTQFLALAHALGNPKEVASRAEAMLFRSALLLEWTAFEIYLRTTIHELLRRHPEKIASGGVKKQTVTYEDLIGLSDQFTSIENLRHRLIEREIERQQGDSDSVHGLINYLKSEFKFKNDPYDAWYFLMGERKVAHYLDLLEVKEVRNLLAHEGGLVDEEFTSKYKDIPTRDGLIAINENYYTKARLMLTSLAFSLGRSIETGDYRT